jgi:hypothetical protein
MNNQEFIKLTIENKKLLEENEALRKKIDQIYKCWLYDTEKYSELKDKYNEVIIKNKIVYDC